MSMECNRLGNVLNEKKTTKMINEIVAYVADSIGSTFGPFGHNALIQTTDNVFSTKDGWTVLQNITFSDPLYNVIKAMIANVAQSTVLIVGDGSTTSTLAANYMNNEIEKLKERYTIREIEDGLVACVNAIIEQLHKNAIAITDDNIEEAIRKVALVSTNWNEELSDIITEIYTKTHNPIIKIDKSGTDKTYVEYIEGFDLAGSLASKDYVTNMESGTCELIKPYILIFNHNVQEKHFVSLSCISEILKPTGRSLVVIAPAFETGFMTKLAATNMDYRRKSHSIVNMVPVKVTNYYTIDKECIQDFAALTNSMIITATDDDFKGFLDDVVITMTKTTDGLEPEAVAAIMDDKKNMVECVVGYMNEISGTCDEMSIGEKSLLIKGLTHANEDIIKDRKESIQAEINKKTREYDALSMLSDDIRMKRIRLGKLQCNMGVIMVGGYGAANIKAKTDALDDATRACEAAYRDGYTIGGSMAILKAIDDTITVTDDSANNQKDSLHDEIFNCIKSAFVSVFKKLFDNKYGEPVEYFDTFDIYNENGETVETLRIEEIISKCIENNYTFNVINNTFDVDRNVINPVNVDIEVLKACMRLVLISATSNQFIFKKYEFSGDYNQEDDIEMKELQ